MKKTGLMVRGCAAFIAMVVMAPAHAAWTMNMTYGDTRMQHKVYDLHMLMFSICVVIGTGVFGVMLYSVIRHRKSRGVEAAHFHENTWVEVVWTIIPFLILIAVAIPAAGVLLRLNNGSNADVTIRVTGHQWLWEYDYPDAGVHFYSRLDARSNAARRRDSDINPDSVPHYLRNVNHPMVVPVNKKVRLLITSGDVIHSWWVPALGGKKDAIPGYINHMWFKAENTGTYRGQCAELCGRGHAFMPIVVKVVTQPQYDQWVQAHGGHLNGVAQPASGQSEPAPAKAASQSAAASSSAAGSQSDQRGSHAQTQDQSNQGGAGQSTSATSSNANASGESSSSEHQTGSGAAGAETVGADTSDNEASKGHAAADQGKQLSMAALMKQGKQVYGHICAACHQPDGSGLPAAGFPSLKNAPIVTGPIAGHIKQVLNGKGAMPAFSGALSDQQIAAVVTYERNSFGNTTGDVVQPSQVAQQR